MRHASITLFVLALGMAGCYRNATTSRAATPSVNDTAVATASGEAYPSRDEVLEYLDGKTIARSDSQAKGGPQFVVQRDQVEALDVERSGTSVGDGPWSTNVTFIASSGMERYAVKLIVQHRRVQNKRAFFGFRLQDIALQ